MCKNSNKKKIEGIFLNIFNKYEGIQSNDIGNLLEKVSSVTKMKACIVVINLKIKPLSKDKIDLEIFKEILDIYITIVYENTSNFLGDINSIIVSSCLLIFPKRENDKEYEMIERASSASIITYKEVSKLIAKTKGKNFLEDKLGIGISFGKVGFGSIGCEERKFYTPFGFPVYIAYDLSFRSNSILCDTEVAKILESNKEFKIEYFPSSLDIFGRKVFIIKEE